MTIYLEIIVALLNPLFWKWVFSGRRDYSLYVLILLVPILFLKITISIKLLSLMISVAYLFYTYRIRQFYLFRYLVLSIIVAIAQFILFYIRPELSIMIGPNNITNMIWGEYATKTYTNFYEVMIGIIRVSGLSREAGFFASLLLCSILFYYLDKRKREYFRWLPLLFGLGYVVSFSKMSLLLIPVFIIIKVKKWINIIHPIVAICIFFTIMMTFWYHSNYLAKEENMTFTHRFGAYGILPDLHDPSIFLLGTSDLKPADYDNSKIAGKYIQIVSDFKFFAGMGGFVITNGLVMTILLIVLLINFQISATGVVLLLFLTLNVQIDTNQNFVTLAYFIVFMYFRTGYYYKKQLDYIIRRKLTKYNH